MSDSPAQKPVPRRAFLDLLLGVGAIGTAASAAYPVLKYLTPLPQSSGGGPVQLDAAQKTELEKQHYVIVTAGTTRIIVFRDESERVRALAAKCTHEGCTVQYLAGESIIWCACHNGRYDLDGRVLSGPPPRPLAQYPIRQEGEDLIVDLGAA